MKSTRKITVDIDTNNLEWYDNTFPGLSRSWLINRIIERFRERFEGEHYVMKVPQVVDEVYDYLKRGDDK